jgi:hypothetical protein
MTPNSVFFKKIPPRGIPIWSPMFGITRSEKFVYHCYDKDGKKLTGGITEDINTAIDIIRI